MIIGIFNIKYYKFSEYYKVTSNSKYYKCAVGTLLISLEPKWFAKVLGPGWDNSGVRAHWSGVVKIINISIYFEPQTDIKSSISG